MKEKEFQCQGEHRVKEDGEARICYCVLPMGHEGLHRDYRDRTWRRLWAWGKPHEYQRRTVHHRY